jgi:hypothetical protein
MVSLGPLEFFVVAFPGEHLPAGAGAALRKVEVSGDVRIIDALVVVRRIGGAVQSAEVTEVAELVEVAADYGLADLGLSLIDVADAWEIARALPAGTTAIALLVEHVWARETAETIAALGGAVRAALRVPAGHAAEATTQQVRRPANGAGHRRGHPLLRGALAGATSNAGSPSQCEVRAADCDYRSANG